jgi:octaprenyl-diphosphate synthase
MIATSDKAAPSELNGTLEVLIAEAAPFLSALDEFIDVLRDEFEPEIRDLAAYCFAKRGKRLRPLLVFFAGRQNAGDADYTHEMVRAAAVVEMVHLATLVHDDILDDASMRHNQATISELHGPAVAVLLGDALFSQALKLAAEFPTPAVCRMVAQATRRVCAGEIAQTLREPGTRLTRAAYDRIIELKTAELFAVSCRLGAHLQGASPEFEEATARFGRQLGIAYQILDDLSDFTGRQEKIGKTLGTDLQKGKQTLPLLLLIEALERDGRMEEASDIITGKLTHFDKILRLLQAYEIPAQVQQEFETVLEEAEVALGIMGNSPVRLKLAHLLKLIRLQFRALM